MKFLAATVESVLLADTPGTFVTRRVDQVTLDMAGIPGDLHYGLTRRSGGREPMYPRGTEIRNRRQLSVVSAEECDQLAQQLGLDAVLPEWLGANLLLRGFPHLTQLPPGSRLLLPSGGGLVCEGENAPCRHPGKIIQALHPTHPHLIKRFVSIAKKQRGIVCSIECPGTIVQGDSLRILVEPIARLQPQMV
ncbi:MOSC domain-containing protein [Stenomitos frigidus]|uniref:MOSC domain-containing protein n=1 Tax=Stenomitos frigidus ULC18 TaxID=2107698 RepID=A0A2T1DT75_9CYAN|nr:MOSC domain-containing protein [Stenomitos frigidus]PSB23698.1 MOSC domain-containing protein [Stenomitos frigidus ULC18]